MSEYIPTIRDYKRLQVLCTELIKDNQALKVVVDGLYNEMERMDKEIDRLCSDNVIDAEIELPSLTA